METENQTALTPEETRKFIQSLPRRERRKLMRFKNAELIKAVLKIKDIVERNKKKSAVLLLLLLASCGEGEPVVTINISQIIGMSLFGLVVLVVGIHYLVLFIRDKAVWLKKKIKEKMYLR